MNNDPEFSTQTLWICAGFLLLFAAAVFLRPLLPIDETRYMTVAWEMSLSKGWLAPLSMNFAPYHHKPPMLFWLINLAWSVFGINRPAGLVPVIVASASVVWLTIKLGKKIMPQDSYDPTKTAFMILGSVPFLIYSTLMMFDLMLTAFVLASLLCLIGYAEKRDIKSIVLLGLFMGLGVLTKGPVAYLHVLFPVLLAPLWVKDFTRPLSWYGGALFAVLISAVPVALWIVPVLAQADNHFAFWLLWEQTAGRVSGNFSDAHVRPLYFYLPMIPALFAPWLFFPSFWRSMKTVSIQDGGIRFLACWIIPVFLSFSFISGKQPHYLVPLIPGTMLLTGLLIRNASLSRIKAVSLSMVGLLLSFQAVGYFTFFQKYDLRPIAEFVDQNKQHDWAFVRNYHGELGFLARLEKPITSLNSEDLKKWFEEHPDGMAVVRYKDRHEIEAYDEVFSYEYRAKNLGVFAMKKK